MYNLVSALGKSKQYNGRWSSVDISDVSMTQLYHDYSDVLVTITSNFAPTIKRTLDLADIKSANIGNSATFSQFLVANGNTTLPTATDTYVLETKYAIYADAIRAHYKATPINSDGHLISPIPMIDRDWLALQRPAEKYPDFDYELMQKSCLVSINGLFHLSDTDGEKLLVVDGAKSQRIAKTNQVGLTSFREVGDLQFIPITESMVHRRYDDVPLSRFLYIDIGQSIINKTAMLVLGGYLHVLDDLTFHRISDRIYAIDFSNYPLLDRYYESRSIIDLTSLELDVSETNDFTVNTQQLYSDEVLTKYVTLSQSFMVFVNTEDLFVEKQALRRSNLPCKFTSYVEPIYPLIVGCGMLGDYWRVDEDKQWALTVNQNWQNNYQFNTVPRSTLVNVDDARSPHDLYDLGRGHFLKIGTDIRKIVGA